ncbi:MAG TPA: sulfotransferase [Terriglobia bacterium]|nr:sulfotransferase [Terriglobia bacterium]
MPRDLILTGIPRSGTTLLTAMVDSVPHAVALNEPQWQREWVLRNRQGTTAKDFAAWLSTDFVETRRKLLDGEPILDRRLRDGSAVTDYYRRRSISRRSNEAFQLVPLVRPDLQPDFILAMKHTGLYLGVLGELLELRQFQIIAILRHPVGVICSWNDVPIPLGEGKMPGAAVYWKEMDDLTRSGRPVLQKQVAIYDLICRRIHDFRDRLRIIRYEDLVQNPNILGAELGCDLRNYAPRIENRKLSFYYKVSAVEEALRLHGRSYRYFYPD